MMLRMPALFALLWGQSVWAQVPHYPWHPRHRKAEDRVQDYKNLGNYHKAVKERSKAALEAASNELGTSKEHPTYAARKLASTKWSKDVLINQAERSQRAEILRRQIREQRVLLEANKQKAKILIKAENAAKNKGSKLPVKDPEEFKLPVKDPEKIKLPNKLPKDMVNIRFLNAAKLPKHGIKKAKDPEEIIRLRSEKLTKDLRPEPRRPHKPPLSHRKKQNLDTAAVNSPVNLVEDSSSEILHPSKGSFWTRFHKGGPKESFTMDLPELNNIFSKIKKEVVKTEKDFAAEAEAHENLVKEFSAETLTEREQALHKAS